MLTGRGVMIQPMRIHRNISMKSHIKNLTKLNSSVQLLDTKTLPPKPFATGKTTGGMLKKKIRPYVV